MINSQLDNIQTDIKILNPTLLLKQQLLNIHHQHINEKVNADLEYNTLSVQAENKGVS